MEQIYCLSHGALLYSVLRLRKSGIYGLADIFSNISDAEFPACIQNAEQELMEKGYGLMDFDGNFTLEESFAELVGQCADERSVLLVDRRKNGRQDRMTCYLGNRVILTQDDRDCVLRSGQSIPAAVLDFLKLPVECKNLEEACVDSGLVTARDISGLAEAGCSPVLAELIVSSAVGEGGYAQLTRITDRVQTQLLAFAWGEAGTVSVGVEYTQEEELFRLTPVTASQAEKQLETMIAG